MSSSLLREVESEELIIYTEQVYSKKTLKKCEEIFDALVEKGEIKGVFYDGKWMCYSDVKHFGIDFTIDKEKYQTHIGKEFGIIEKTMGIMLRCYAIYCNGIYIYSTIAKGKICVIKDFLEKYKDESYKISHEDFTSIEDFLVFISTPEAQIKEIASNIRLIKSKSASQRLLRPIINYLVIENEINYMYNLELEDETFIKWFPIYFWVNITFILPLRATEMLLTPKNCISHINGKTILHISRTRLKKGFRKVYYDVNKDYLDFLYEIPDDRIAENIEKYIALTGGQDRRFLFEYNRFMLNNMLSLVAFNKLVFDFVNENIIGNHTYDFAKYALGIKEFESVTAGDSRPIAMANLYFQNSGADICRQLADHVSINTSSGYYTNVSETIWASSIIQLQRIINHQQRDSDEQLELGSKYVVTEDESVCVSLRREKDQRDLTDCIEQGHLEDCMGCKFYRPTKHELDTFLSSQKKKADKSAKRVIEFMNNTMSVMNKGLSLDDVYLSVQTDATRYRMGCNIKAKEKQEEWQRLKNSQKINC